jgi:hypothetical protein
MPSNTHVSQEQEADSRSPLMVTDMKYQFNKFNVASLKAIRAFEGSLEVRDWDAAYNCIEQICKDADAPTTDTCSSIASLLQVHTDLAELLEVQAEVVEGDAKTVETWSTMLSNPEDREEFSQWVQGEVKAYKYTHEIVEKVSNSITTDQKACDSMKDATAAEQGRLAMRAGISQYWMQFLPTLEGETVDGETWETLGVKAERSFLAGESALPSRV